MLKITALVVGLYILICLVLYVTQRKMLYFPQPATALSDFPQIEIKAANGVHLEGWVINPKSDEALLYFGGNAEAIGENATYFARTLPGYSVYLIPYRGYGNSTGTPTEPNLYADALLIYDQIAAQHSVVVAMGRSLGTGIATYLAANRKIAKLVLVTPYDSIESLAQQTYWMFPIKWLLKDKYRSWQHIKQIDTEVLAIIAGQDRVIPLESTKKLLIYCNSMLLRTVTIDEADHNNVSTFAKFDQALLDFLN